MDHKGFAYCGARDDGTAFVDIDHAALSGDQGRHAQACSNCVNVVMAMLAKARYEEGLP